MKNIALIGFGYMGKKYFQTSLKIKNILINKILKKRVTNIKIPNVKFFRNPNMFLNYKNTDGYIIATPVSNHYRYARKIINKKKPFIIEKPLVSNMKELEKLYKICRNYKQSIFVNHTDLYNPAFSIFLKNLKTVGQYKKINIFFGKFQKIKRFADKNKGKFSFLPSFDWLPHPIALAIKLAGYPKKILIRENKIFIKKKYIFQKCKICLYCKKNDVNINFSTGYSSPKRRIEINGSKATLIYDGYKKNMIIKKCKGKSPKKIFYKNIHPCENLLRLFYFSIKNGFYKNDIHFTYKVMKILFIIDNELKNK